MKSIIDRQRGECCYPMIQKRQGVAQFCCRPSIADSSYCARHHRICYQPTPELNQRPQRAAPNIGERPQIKPLDQIFTSRTLRRFEWIK